MRATLTDLGPRILRRLPLLLGAVLLMRLADLGLDLLAESVPWLEWLL